MDVGIEQESLTKVEGFSSTDNSLGVKYGGTSALRPLYNYDHLKMANFDLTTHQ